MHASFLCEIEDYGWVAGDTAKAAKAAQDPVFLGFFDSLCSAARRLYEANVTKLSQVKSSYSVIDSASVSRSYPRHNYSDVMVEAVKSCKYGSSDDLKRMYGELLSNLWVYTTEQERNRLLQQFDVITQQLLDEKQHRMSNLPRTEAGEGGYAPLDDYAFAEERPGEVPLEKDNALEKDLLKSIRDHLISSTPLTDAHADLLRKMLQTGAYREIIHEPPQGSSVYRGMAVSRDWILKVLKKQGTSLATRGTKECAFTFTPINAGATSWTVSENVAKSFGDAEDNKGKFNLVMYAAVDANPQSFVMCPEGLYNVQGLEDHIDEQEAIGLGTIKVYKIHWKPAAPRMLVYPRHGWTKMWHGII